MAVSRYAFQMYVGLLVLHYLCFVTYKYNVPNIEDWYAEHVYGCNNMHKHLCRIGTGIV